MPDRPEKGNQSVKRLLVAITVIAALTLGAAGSASAGRTNPPSYIYPGISIDVCTSPTLNAFSVYVGNETDYVRIVADGVEIWNAKVDPYLSWSAVFPKERRRHHVLKVTVANDGFGIRTFVYRTKWCER